MFKNLLKYEFKANGKVLLPAYGIGIAGSLVLRLLQWLLGSVSPVAGSVMNEVFQGLVGIYAVALLVMSLGYVVIRFFRSMVGAEAYLTLTLPVKNTAHIWAKYISGLCFSVLGVGACLLTLQAYSFSGFGVDQTGLLLGQKISVIAFVVCLLLVVIAWALMTLYFCCAVGSQFKNKVAASVVTYFVTSNAVGFLSIGLMAPAAYFVQQNYGDQIIRYFTRLDGMSEMAIASELMPVVLQYMWIFLLVLALYFAVLSTVQFLVSRYLLTKKVNLE